MKLPQNFTLQPNNEADFKEAAVFKGRKLGLLIASLTVADQVKEAFLDLLPFLNLKQIEELIDVLEAQVIQEQTKGIDKELISKLEAIKMASEHQKNELTKTTVTKIEELTKQIVRQTISYI